MKKRGAKGIILKAKSGRQPDTRLLRRKIARDKLRKRRRK
jgi:hypothetical protein